MRRKLQHPRRVSFNKSSGGTSPISIRKKFVSRAIHISPNPVQSRAAVTIWESKLTEGRAFLFWPFWMIYWRCDRSPLTEPYITRIDCAVLSLTKRCSSDPTLTYVTAEDQRFDSVGFISATISLFDHVYVDYIEHVLRYIRLHHRSNSN